MTMDEAVSKISRNYATTGIRGPASFVQALADLGVLQLDSEDEIIRSELTKYLAGFRLFHGSLQSGFSDSQSRYLADAICDNFELKKKRTA